MHTYRTTLVSVVAFALAACSAKAPTADEQFLEQVHAKIRSDLKDPDSAQFQKEEVHTTKKVACGEVNAKNSFGGYTGFDGYSYYDEQPHLQSDEFDNFMRGQGLCTVAKAEQGIEETRRSELPEVQKRNIIKTYQEVIDGVKRNPTFQKHI